MNQRYPSHGKGAIVSRHNRKKPKTLSATRLALFHASIQAVEKTGPEEKESPRDRETEVSECIDAPEPSYCLTGLHPCKNPISSSPGKSNPTCIPGATQHPGFVEVRQGDPEPDCRSMASRP